MGRLISRYPTLETLYQRYLSDHASAGFVKAVASIYTVGTLERLAECGQRNTRRAATMALGFLGDFASNQTMGRRLSDEDRGVRLLAENGIRELWLRDGSPAQQQWLLIIIRLNNSQQPVPAERQASQLIEQAPYFAEAWNQRAIALYLSQRFDESANDCFQALELNPYHYGAAVGMGQCYLELNDPVGALVSFRRALTLHPGLEDVRAQVSYLERALEGK